MSGAATSQYGVASTTAMAGQTPPTGAGAGSASDYTAFGIYGEYFNFVLIVFLNSGLPRLEVKED